MSGAGGEETEVTTNSQIHKQPRASRHELIEFRLGNS